MMKRHHKEEVTQGVEMAQRPMTQKRGVVTAISHVLNSNFVGDTKSVAGKLGEGRMEAMMFTEDLLRHGSKMFFLELLIEPQAVVYVTSSLESQTVWLTQINIDSSYCFTHLQPRQIVFKNGSIFMVWQTCEMSRFSEVEESYSVQVNDSNHLLSYEGCVTDVFRPLAMFQLDNKLNLCAALMVKVSDVPELCVGQHVIVYNAHCVSRDLMMCARSRVSIVPHPEQSVPAGAPGREVEKYLPLIDLSNELRLSFRDILWLKKQFHILEEKFDEKFLFSLTIPRAFHNQLLQNLLASIVQWNTLDRELRPVRKLAAEFLDHDLCDLDKESGYYQDLLNVSQVSQLGIPELENWFWRSNLWDGSEEGRERSLIPLVGYLSSSNGYWMLSDETGSLPCIITGLSADKWHNIVKALSGNIVVITKFQLIQEVFQVTKYTYLHFSTKDCRPFNLQNNYPTLDSLCSMCEGIPGYTHSCPKGSVRRNPESGPSNGDPGPSQRDCETQRSGQELRPQRANESSVQRSRPGLDCETDSLEVVVHHLSHLMVVCKGTMTTCHMQATITKRNMPNRSKRVTLLLKGPLLKSVPLIQIGALYHLHTAEADNLFINSNHINNFSREMKTSGLRTVPQDATFIHCGAPLACSDYYSVSEASSCEVGDELTNVEGIIFDRLHKELKYPSELRSVETAGYGVPGGKSIIVKIRDIASAVSLSVYINSWYQRAYPIGLILGAHVAFTNLQQKMSVKNSVYLVTTGLSSVVVKDMNRPPHFESKEDWGAPCNLLLAVPSKKLLWGTIEMDQLLKVSVQFRCEYCSHLFIRGRCSYVGCWSHSKGEIAAVCTFKAHHADKEALVIVKGDNVRVVLDMSENQWCQLKLLAKQAGELVYLRGSVAPPDISTCRAQHVFWLYCKVVVADQMKLLHIQAKKFPDSTKNIPILCCVNIKEDRPRIFNSFSPQELDAIYGYQGQT